MEVTVRDNTELKLSLLQPHSGAAKAAYEATRLSKLSLDFIRTVKTLEFPHAKLRSVVGPDLLGAAWQHYGQCSEAATSIAKSYDGTRCAMRLDELTSALDAMKAFPQKSHASAAAVAATEAKLQGSAGAVSGAIAAMQRQQDEARHTVADSLAAMNAKLQANSALTAKALAVIDDQRKAAMLPLKATIDDFTAIPAKLKGLQLPALSTKWPAWTATVSLVPEGLPQTLNMWPQAVRGRSAAARRGGSGWLAGTEGLLEPEPTIVGSSGESIVDALLAEFDPYVGRIIDGARWDLASGNPDAADSVGHRLRKLIEQVLQRLAPQKEAERWAAAHKHDGHRDEGVRLMQMRYLYSTVVCTDVPDDAERRWSNASRLHKRCCNWAHEVHSDVPRSALVTALAETERLLLEWLPFAVQSRVRH